MRRDDRIRMLHMLDAAREALAFASGKTRSDLDENRALHTSDWRCCMNKLQFWPVFAVFGLDWP